MGEDGEPGAAGAPAGESHEEVVSSLLDLQRRLRGDQGAGVADPAAGPRAARTGVAAPRRVPTDAVEVRADEDLRVVAAPAKRTRWNRRTPPPGDRARAFEERLARLERDLDALLAEIHDLGGRGA